jgi:hypothetical protein
MLPIAVAEEVVVPCMAAVMGVSVAEGEEVATAVAVATTKFHAKFIARPGNVPCATTSTSTLAIVVRKSMQMLLPPATILIVTGTPTPVPQTTSPLN